MKYGDKKSWCRNRRYMYMYVYIKDGGKLFGGNSDGWLPCGNVVTSTDDVMC